MKKESKEQRNGEVKCVIVVDFFSDFLNLQVLFFNKTTNRA